MKNKNQNGKRPTTKEDLDTLEAHLVDALAKTLDHYATKEDIKALATKEDIKTLVKKVDNVDYKLSDVQRRVIDLETIDSPTRTEFNKLREKIPQSP